MDLDLRCSCIRKPHDLPINNHGKDASVAIEHSHREWESQVYMAIRLLVSLGLSMEDDSSSVPFEPEALCGRLFFILLDLANSVAKEHIFKKACTLSIVKRMREFLLNLGILLRQRCLL